MSKLGFIQPPVPDPNYTDLLLFEQEEFGTIRDNKNLEAGWTYFGQMMSHDLTMQREFSGDRPYLRLQCLYGAGPKANGFLYEFRGKGRRTPFKFRGVKFALNTYKGKKAPVTDVLRYFREGLNVPLMADIRNDENFILSQLHCLFLQFHNQVAEYLYDPKKSEEQKEQVYAEARQAVVWTYQYLILNEYLPKLMHNSSLTKLSLDKFKIIDAKSYPQPFLTPEFIVAALRVGHSQVRQFYKINDTDEVLELYSSAPQKQADLRGFKQDKRRHGVDWSLFFDTGNPNRKVQSSRLMDLLVSPPLGVLPFMPDNNQNLGHINLKRSKQHGLLLPKGELNRIASNLGIDTIQDVDREVDIRFAEYPPNSRIGELAVRVKEVKTWPLWAFILLEADIRGSVKVAGTNKTKQTLGPLGSQIFAEQLLWILLTDEESYLKKQPDWKPTDILKSYTPQGQQFGMADVIAIAQGGLTHTDISHQPFLTMSTRTAAAPLADPVDPRDIPFDRIVDLTTFSTLKSDCANATTRASILLGYANDNISTILYAKMWQQIFGSSFPLASQDAIGVNFIWYIEGNDLKLSAIPFDEDGMAVGPYSPPATIGAVRGWLRDASSATISAKQFSFTAAQVAAWLQISGPVPAATANFVLVALEAADAKGTRRFSLGIQLNSTEAAWGRPCPPFCYPN